LPETKSFIRRHKKKLAALAIIASTAVANKADDYKTQADLKAVSANMIVPEQINRIEPLTPETLKVEYEKVKELRDIYSNIAGTRHQIRRVGDFLLQAGPGMVETKLSSHENVSFTDLDEAGIDLNSLAALVDLGAFDLRKLRDNKIDFTAFAKKGIGEIVIMEDRDPMFYLNYGQFEAAKEVPLNRHGNKEDKWNMSDLQDLVSRLHGAGLKVEIGFWGNSGNKDGNPFIKRNWDNLKPVFPTSDDINPLSFVIDADGSEMPCADYIVNQFRKLNRDFKFDGLFLGDGLMGFRAFMDPEGPYTAEQFSGLWSDFYKRIRLGIKEANPDATLWAYDCLANGLQESRHNGLDLDGIAPNIDNYVFQSYGNDAWGDGYMNLPGYDLRRDEQQIASLPPSLKAKTRYSIGLGDSVEGWHGSKQGIKDKHSYLSSYAKKGTLGVWSNELLRSVQ
jgi:hypothetical protein